MKHQVKDAMALSELDSHGRPIWSLRRKQRKFVEDKNFDQNGPFYKILDRRSMELEIERQDLKKQKYLESIKLLFDNDCQKPANCDNGLLQNVTTDGSQLLTVDGTDPKPSVCHEDIVLAIGDNTAQQNSEETVTVDGTDPHPSVCHEDIVLAIGDNTAQQNSEQTVTVDGTDPHPSSCHEDIVLAIGDNTANKTVSRL